VIIEGAWLRSLIAMNMPKRALALQKRGLPSEQRAKIMDLLRNYDKAMQASSAIARLTTDQVRLAIQLPEQIHLV
jgi:hypothetical protein